MWHDGAPTDPPFDFHVNNLTIEGIVASEAPGDVEIRVSTTLPGPGSGQLGYVVEDRARVTVVDVDLAIDGRTESDEETDPRPMAVNDDDDNTNRECDSTESGPVADEDETVEMRASITPDVMQGLWSVNGRPSLLYWTTPQKGDLLFHVLATELPTPIAASPFWAECLAAQPTSRTTALTYIPCYSAGPYSDPAYSSAALLTDSVNIDCLDVEIDLDGLNDCEELTVGGLLEINDDDDDGIPGIDREYSYTLGALSQPDPDLVALRVAFSGPIPVGEARLVHLHAIDGSDDVRLWTTDRKARLLDLADGIDVYFDADGHDPDLVMQAVDDVYTKTFYLEGYQCSGTANDVILLAEYDREGRHYIDAVELSVFRFSFEPSVPDEGFDETTNPPWLLVAEGGSKAAIATITPSNLPIAFLVDSASTCSVAPSTASGSPQLLTVSGVTHGHACVSATHVSGKEVATLGVCVKRPRQVTVDFHFMSDGTYSSARTSQEVASFLSAMNDIWAPQACVTFSQGTIDNPVCAPLGPVVLWAATEPANEWDDIVLFRRLGPPDVYFVWEYDQDGSTGADAACLDGDILFEDAAGVEVGETLAHEMGHYLGVDPSDYQDNSNELMHAFTDVRGRKVLHVQADMANP